MPSFTDCNGRKWSAVITIGTAKRLRARDIDLGDVTNPAGSVMRALADPILASEMVYECSDPIDGEKPTYEEFIDTLTGDVIDEMLSAFWDALVNFTRGPAGEALRRTKNLQGKIKNRIIQRVQKAIPEEMTEEEIDKVLDNLHGISGTGSTDSPG